MSDCACTCHKGTRACGICCPDTAAAFLKPANTEDKSKAIVESLFKGKK